MSPVRYELGFYIPEDGILHSQCSEEVRSYVTSSTTGLSHFTRGSWAPKPVAPKPAAVAPGARSLPSLRVTFSDSCHYHVTLERTHGCRRSERQSEGHQATDRPQPSEVWRLYEFIGPGEGRQCPNGVRHMFASWKNTGHLSGTNCIRRVLHSKPLGVPWVSCKNRSFGGTYRLHYQDEKNRRPLFLATAVNPSNQGR
jgi:hypothetical protein